MGAVIRPLYGNRNSDMWGQSYVSVRCQCCPHPLHLGSIHPIIGSAISRCSLHNPYFKRVLQGDSPPSSLCLIPPHFLMSFPSLHPTTCPITGAPNHFSPLYSLIHILSISTLLRLYSEIIAPHQISSMEFFIWLLLPCHVAVACRFLFSNGVYHCYVLKSILFHACFRIHIYPR